MLAHLVRLGLHSPVMPRHLPLALILLVAALLRLQYITAPLSTPTAGVRSIPPPSRARFMRDR